MKRSRRAAAVAALALLLAVLSTVALGSAPAGGRRGHSAAGEEGKLDLAAVRSFRRFRIYSVGRSHAGLDLAAITRRADAADKGGYAADYVSFLYGTCQPASGAGCALPLEVQSWPACLRTLADYRLTPYSEVLLPHTRLTVRGVPAAMFEEAPGLVRLELYTGRETVVLFGHDRTQLLVAARSLRGVNTSLAPAVDLPPPTAGAIAGRLACPAEPSSP